MKLFLPLLLLLLSINSFALGERDSLALILEDYIDQIDPVLPVLDPVLNQNISNVSVCKGPRSTYYLTGTVGEEDGVNTGIQVWASKDLHNWNLIGTNGYVWTFEGDAKEWQKEISVKHGYKQRAIISPRIYYFNNTFWISYSLTNTNQSGILKSVSGHAQGPYDNISGDEALISGMDISLLQGSDSTLYCINNKGLAYRLNSSESGLSTAEPRSFQFEDGDKPKFKQTFVAQSEGTYYLWGSLAGQILEGTPSSAYEIAQREDAMIYASKYIFGPYKRISSRIPHAGTGSFLKDFNGNYQLLFSSRDVSSSITLKPVLLQLTEDDEQLTVKNRFSCKPVSGAKVIYVSPIGNNASGENWEDAFTSVQRAVDMAPANSQIWIASGKYDAPIVINLKRGLHLLGGFNGTEKDLDQRDSDVNKTIFSGRNYAKHVIAISSSEYIRIDGITLQGGNASGGSFHHHYGAGLHVLGGGETVRVVNCQFENNKADQDGGAVYASVGAAPVFIQCSFKNNVARNNGGAAAMYCNNVNGYSARFYNCQFDNNFAYGDGGAIYFDSNLSHQGLLLLVNNLITNNTTLKASGAIYADRNANLLMLNSTVCFNKGTSQGAVLGSFGKVPGKTRILNSIFYQNYGGVLFSIEGEAEKRVINNTVSYPNVWVQFSNCLFEDNDVMALVERSFDRNRWRTFYELNESVMGKACLKGSPSFLDPVNDNYRLNGGSFAKGAGTGSVYFRFSYDVQRRSSQSVNIGCF